MSQAGLSLSLDKAFVGIIVILNFKLDMDFSTTRKIRVVQQEGTRNVHREIDHYNLDAIISVGYRVNSIRATQFRRWATQVLSQYTQKGYVIDRKRMENGTFLDEDYFEELLEEIREIRLSERRFYQKLTDIHTGCIMRCHIRLQQKSYIPVQIVPKITWGYLLGKKLLMVKF